MNAQAAFAELCPQHVVERCVVSQGGYWKNKTPASYVKTQSGEIERSVWRCKIRSLIRKAGEEELFELLLEWVNDHTPWLKTDGDRLNYALELHSARLFDSEDWVDFVPFNLKHRPERLASAGLVPVVTECCSKECIVTLSQIQRGDGKVCCPYCGRFSSYTTKGTGETDEHYEEKR